MSGQISESGSSTTHEIYSRPLVFCRSRDPPLAYSVISPAIHPPVMSKVDNSSTNQPTKEDAIPGLGVLEEDDEFEEFPVQGRHLSAPNFRSVSYVSFITRCASNTLDWDDSQTDLANLASAGAAGSAARGDKLWEDNWDDDDIEEELSTNLRLVVLLHPAFTYRLRSHLPLSAEPGKTKTK